MVFIDFSIKFIAFLTPFSTFFDQNHCFPRTPGFCTFYHFLNDFWPFLPFSVRFLPSFFYKNALVGPSRKLSFFRQKTPKSPVFGVFFVFFGDFWPYQGLHRDWRTFDPKHSIMTNFDPLTKVYIGIEGLLTPNIQLWPILTPLTKVYKGIIRFWSFLRTFDPKHSILTVFDPLTKGYKVNIQFWSFLTPLPRVTRQTFNFWPFLTYFPL